jgi:hypothetical protein
VPSSDIKTFFIPRHVEKKKITQTDRYVVCIKRGRREIGCIEICEDVTGRKRIYTTAQEERKKMEKN